ncbi:AMP-binding protein [Nocardioides humi]|uniref:Medium-chain fatty-acid--CoA ligase n=1 Tax=Nocardioides humi TaxID=449461 RepID=A0ABN2A4N6_9ACTN|nr:AMP-binding protein [Nocardioides humi]
MATSSQSAVRLLRDVVTPAERRELYRSRGHWNSDTLADRLAQHAAARPEKTAVVDLAGTRRRTYAELYADVCRMVRVLTEAGVEPGDVVAVQLPNWYETVVVDLAVLARGAVLNTMLPIYRGKEMRHMLSAAGSKLLVTPAVYRRFDHAALAAELVDELPALRTHLVVPDPVEQPAALDGLLEGHAAAPYPSGLDPEAVSELMFTSGTESTPKAIMHTESTTEFGVRAAGEALGLTAEDIVWMPSPIGHSTGFNYGLRMALHHGLTLCLQDKWDAAEAVRTIQDERCTYTVAATTFLADVLDEADRVGADLSSMRRFSSGGAAVPPHLVRRASELGMTVLRLYGSTEVLIGSWNRPESPETKRIETDGLPFDAVELEVRRDGRAVVGEPGVIYVRSPSASVGFFNDPERTASTFDADGWVESGDLGVLDADGYLTIVGRTKEIIIRGGLNIAPREIEELIVKLPEVAACAVVPVPDDRLGEIACACVVLQPGAALTLAELTTALRGFGLAAFKLPERLEVVDSLPTTTTGKVQKNVLVDRLADAAGSRGA